MHSISKIPILLVNFIMNITACCRYWVYLVTLWTTKSRALQLKILDKFFKFAHLLSFFFLNYVCEIRRGILQNQIIKKKQNKDSEMEIATQTKFKLNFIHSKITLFPKNITLYNNAKLQTAICLINKKTKTSQLRTISCALQIQCYAMIEYR